MQKRNAFFQRGHAFLSLCILALLTVSVPFESLAAVSSDNAFENTAWEQILEAPLQSPTGVVQSICSTEDYIICLENTSDLTGAPDTVSAYYKNTVDEQGNAVEQYTLAKQLTETNYEHANGMAYNPEKKEIYVAGYTSQDPENTGCLFIMDSETLRYKGKIKIADDYNILGIGYKADTDQYVIQTNAQGSYSFKLLDNEFHIIEELGSFTDSNEGSNYQDLCISGDYIINFPLTLYMNIGDFIHMYSISQQRHVSSSMLNFNFGPEVVNDEPESICEIAPGEFAAAVHLSKTDGTKVLRLYKNAGVPYLFSIQASGENASLTERTSDVARGGSYTVGYAAADNYELVSVLVDGKEIDLEKHPDSYTFENVQSNHTVQVVTEKPVISTKSGKAGSAANAAAVSPKQNHLSLLQKVIVIAIISLSLAFALYLRILYVQRARAKKRRRNRRLREQYYRMNAIDV